MVLPFGGDLISQYFFYTMEKLLKNGVIPEFIQF